MCLSHEMIPLKQISNICWAADVAIFSRFPAAAGWRDQLIPGCHVMWAEVCLCSHSISMQITPSTHRALDTRAANKPSQRFHNLLEPPLYIQDIIKTLTMLNGK